MLTSISPIIKLHSPTPEVLCEATSKGVPVLITGLLRHFPDIMRINPLWLLHAHPNMPALLNTSMVEQEQTGHIKVPLGAFCEHILHTDEHRLPAHKNLYLAESMEFLDKLDVDDDVEEFINEMCKHLKPAYKAYAFWLGPRGSKTGLHYDIDHRNFLMQTYGLKIFYLAPPCQSHLMYKSDKFEHEGGVSQVNFFDPDYAQYPLFSHAHFMKILLRPGDIIYVPAMWWHAVYNPTGVCAVSARFETIGSKIKQFPEWLKFKMHKAGLYKPGNCTCCGKGTHRWD